MPEQIATAHRLLVFSDAVMAFLESAPFVTGEILHVAGGQSAGH